MLPTGLLEVAAGPTYDLGTGTGTGTGLMFGALLELLLLGSVAKLLNISVMFCLPSIFIGWNGSIGFGCGFVAGWGGRYAGAFSWYSPCGTIGTGGELLILAVVTALIGEEVADVVVGPSKSIKLNYFAGAGDVAAGLPAAPHDPVPQLGAAITDFSFFVNGSLKSSSTLGSGLYCGGGGGSLCSGDASLASFFFTIPFDGISWIGSW